MSPERGVVPLVFVPLIGFIVFGPVVSESSATLPVHPVDLNDIAATLVCGGTTLTPYRLIHLRGRSTGWRSRPRHPVIGIHRFCILSLTSKITTWRF